MVVTADARQQPFLDECLDSLRGQLHRNLQILLVPYDASDPLLATARRHTSDRRVTVLATEPDLAAARDAGARAARGEYLCFATGADTVPPAGTEILVASLVASGSDLAVGDLTQAAPFKHLTRSEHRSVHGRTRTGTTFAQAPELARDLLVENRLFRRSFWDATGLCFGSGPADTVMAEALLRAERLDVRREVSYHAMSRGDGLAFGTLRPSMPELDAWLAAQQRLLALAGDGPTAVAYVRGVLDSAVQRFLDDAERADAAQWTALSGFVASCLERAGVDGSAAVRAEPRVRAWLAAEGRRADLETLVSRRWADQGHPTEVRDGRVLAVLPLDGLAGVPDDVRALSADEVRPVLQLRTLHWVGRRLRLVLFGYLDQVDLDTAPPQVAVTLVAADGTRLPCPQVEPLLDLEMTRWADQRHHGYAHGAFGVLLPEVGGGSWAVEVTLSYGGLHGTARLDQLFDGGGAAVPRERADGQATATARVADEDGAPVLRIAVTPGPPPRGPATTVEEITLDGALLRVRTTGPADGLAVTGRGMRLLPVRTSPDGEAWFDLRHDAWEQGLLPLASGRYALAADRPVAAADGLLDTFPLHLLGDRHRVVVTGSPRGRLALALRPPLTDDELGQRAQTRLKAWHAELDEPLRDDLVYLQSYPGESATDSQLEIFHELRRTHPEVQVQWGVADRSKWLPDDAEPVLLGSREHYRALATARVVCANIELDRWYRRRPGQTYLQTFHGYPSKAMGVPLWEAKGWTPLRVAAQLAQTSGAWNLALTPTEEMDRVYRETYRYDGEVAHLGYPRNDPLVGADAAAVRDAIRARLGIADGTTAVLYAPTWRDDLATAYRAAALPGDFDVAAVARALGDGFVVLARGHRFHADGGASAPNVVDVTSYPQVNDLVLAADAAVLDYSSLRFDFALTGRPMVFHVPDLADYTGGVRGFLMPFEETAPGPLCASQEQVVDALRRLPQVAAEHADDLAVFNARFNPLHDGHAAERVVRRLYDS